MSTQHPNTRRPAHKVDDDRLPDLVMSDRTREQLRRIDAEITAGTYKPAPSDDTRRIAGRLAELRARQPAPIAWTDDPGADRALARDEPGAVAWWAPAGPGEVTITRGEAVHRLTEHGLTPDQAQAAVTRYLDDTSREVGTPVHQWGLDSHDVEAIARTHHTPGTVPEPRAAPADRIGDDERREQLIRWHTDDHADGAAEHDAVERGGDGPVRAIGDPASVHSDTEGR